MTEDEKDELIITQQEKIDELNEKIEHLESKLEDMELNNDDLIAERSMAQDEAETAAEDRDELQDKLDETIVPKTLEDEMKLKMLVRISEQCNLTQIEALHQFAIDYFPNFNPHI